MHPLEIEIIKSAARTLFVSTYADACDNGEIDRLLAEREGYKVKEVFQVNDEDPLRPADFVPDEPGWYWEKGDDYCGPFNDEEEAWKEAGQDLQPYYPTASMGSDWMDVAPETPEAALIVTAMEFGAYEQNLRKLRPDSYQSIFYVLREAAIADGLCPAAKSSDDAFSASVDAFKEAMSTAKGRRGCSYAEEFGHCLAMMWMGHGVSWFDDHEDFDLPDWHGFEGGSVSLQDLGFELSMVEA